MILCIAVGSSLRGDDNAGHRVLRLLEDAGLGGQSEGRPLEVLSRKVVLRDVMQLTPELAAEIAHCGTVVFIDADPFSSDARVEPLPRNGSQRTPLTHGMTPAEVVELAERWYEFKGAAFLCRVPATRFEVGEELSEQACAAVRAAATRLQEFLLSAIENSASAVGMQ